MNVLRQCYVVLAAFIAVNVLYAEEGVLVVSVADPAGKPVAGVVLSTKGDGSTGSPTDISGKTRLRLAPQTRPGSWVTLQLTKSSAGRDLAIISPWDHRVTVPSFSNDSENYVPLIVADRSSRDVLASKDTLLALAAKVASKYAPRTPDTTQTASRSRTEVLKETALEYGLSPEEVDSAIRAWSSKATDPYSKGIASFYKGEFAEAAPQLTDALKRSLATIGRKDSAQIVDSAFFLGRALYEEGKYGAAVQAFRQALQFREGDLELLANLGLATVNIQSQVGTASDGSVLIQSQATTLHNNNYIVTVQKEGSASSLISGARSQAAMEPLLGFINREASAAFGLWEAQLRKFHEEQDFSSQVTSMVADAVATARKELRDVQSRCASALARNELAEAKAQLFLLDGLASELAAKAGKTRPISR